MMFKRARLEYTEEGTQRNFIDTCLLSVIPQHELRVFSETPSYVFGVPSFQPPRKECLIQPSPSIC